MADSGVAEAPTQQRRRLPASPLAAGAAVAVLALDQLTKWWALRALDDRDIDLIGSLRFHLVFNRGSAFGLGSRFAPLIALAVMVIVVLVLHTGRRMQGVWSLVSIGLVVGGALGNLSDRVLREGDGVLGGAVVDWIDLQWWPVFNVADAAVVVGGIMLVLAAGREEAPEDAAAGP